MRIRMVTLSGSMEAESRLVGQLANDPEFDLAFRCVDRAEALAIFRAGGIDVALCVGVAPWFDFQCAQEADRAGVRLLGVAADPVEADMLEVAGFAVVRDLQQVRELAGEQRAAPPLPEAAPPGKIVAVWGPKGSPGRTTVSIELAAVLAETQPRTLLVDADLYGGDIAQLLGVVEELPGIVPLCRLGARGALRDEAWVQELKQLRDGPFLLPGLVRAALWSEVSTFGWAELLDALRRSFPTALVDVGFCLEASSRVHEGPGRNEVAITALESADRVVAVVRADPVGIRSFLWAFTEHKELLDPDRTVIVVNRVRCGEEDEVARLVRRHVGRPPLAFVPDRPDHLARAAWSGLPVATTAPSSPISEAMRDLAARLGGEVLPRGFLSRLVGRRAGV